VSFDPNNVDWKTADMIRKHQNYLNNYPGGHRADLRGTRHNGALLNGVDLRRALMSGADFRGAQFVGANLSEATLAGSRLSAPHAIPAPLMTHCRTPKA
jgi:uncharacterized protein YjbI with pentapeptide repeats